MARIRTIKPDFFLNDTLAACDPLARLLFAGLWCHGDRAGRLPDRPKRLQAQILPFDVCDIEALLQQLHDAGFICRYEAAGQRCIQIVHFLKHQRPHVKEPPSNLPPPPDSLLPDVPPPAEMPQAAAKQCASKEGFSSRNKPLFNGCRHVRITPDEMEKEVLPYYKGQNLAHLLPCALEHLDQWLSKGTAAAKRSLNASNHWELLLDTHVLAGARARFAAKSTEVLEKPKRTGHGPGSKYWGTDTQTKDLCNTRRSASIPTPIGDVIAAALKGK